MRSVSWWLCLLVLAGCGVFVGLRFEMTTGITHFLPEGTDRELAPLSRELADSELTRTLVFTVHADDLDTAIAATRELAHRLDHDEIARVHLGPPEDLEQAVHDVFFPRRHAFVTDTPDQLADPAWLAARVTALREALSRPGLGALTRQLAPADPLRAFEEHVHRLRQLGDGALETRDGVFVVKAVGPAPSASRFALGTSPCLGEDACGSAAIQPPPQTGGDVREADRGGVLFAQTVHSPFDGQVQGPFVDWLEAEVAALERELGVDVEMSSVHRFAVSSERSIRADITRISIASTIGLVLLFAVFLRRLRYVLTAFLPLGAGVLTALAFHLAILGPVHGLTLAFGAALVGVCIDYPIHLFNHHTLDPARGGAAESMRRIWMGLFVGAATTVAGFSGLAWTTFPGIREIALFASVGVAASLLVTRFGLVPLLPAAPPAVAVQQRTADALERLLGAMGRHRLALLALPAAAGVVCAVGLPRVHWVDDVSALNELDPALLAEDTRVRDRVSRMESGRMVIALGPDTETALQRNDAVAARLAQARDDGLVDDYRSLHAVVWSARLQRANLEAVHDPAFAERARLALDAGDFEVAAFTPFFQTLERPPPRPLTLDALADESPAIASLFDAMHVRLDDGRVAILSLLHGAHDTDALAARLADLDGVYVFDQAAFLERTWRTVRARSIELILVGLLAVFAMLLLRYRSPRVALAAFVPAALAAATTLGVFGLLGTPTHMLHVVSLLLVLSIGVDYGVFLAETRRHGRRALGATLLSIVMACLSTVLAFGLLAMSSMPALHAIGTSIGIGVLLSLLLAPVAVVIAGTHDEAHA